MNVEYIGRLHNECKMCGKYSYQQYSYTPHKAIINLFSEDQKKPINICEICARRETEKSKWSLIKRNKNV